MSYDLSKEAETLNKELKIWNEGCAKFWDYSASLAKLEIRLTKKYKEGNAHVVCVRCHWLSGPTHWSNTSLVVKVSSLCTLHGTRQH